MRRAGVVLAVLAAAAFAAGCASADHSWQGEFDARLEGAARTVEEAREAWSPRMRPDEYMTVFWPYGKSLFFKAELIAELDPPKGCEALQVKGKAAVYVDSQMVGGAFKNLTPQVEQDFATTLEDAVALLERREREAATCGATS
jgi:hypothetical protein